MEREEISPNAKTNALSISKNSLRLDIDVKSLKYKNIRGMMSMFVLELEYRLLDLRFNEIAVETLTIESKHSTGQDFSRNFAHTLKEGLCQFIANSQKNGWLQLEIKEEVPFTALKDSPRPENNNTTFIDARNSVVTIITENGHGSGCRISNNGYILTNFHVVSKSDTIKVVTFQGDTLLGEVSMIDPSLDIAIVKTDQKSQDYFELKENKLPLGETVYAIGTPIDLKLSQSISKGIVSAHLVLNEIDYIQTDAEINGGNSGGALVNSNGDLVGLVNAKAVGMFVEGIGFAIDLESIIERINISYK
jgi:S1-C subfamily serine protease